MAFNIERAVKESNTIEGVANEGAGLEDHMAAARYMLDCVEKEQLINPRACHTILMINMELPPPEKAGEYRQCAVTVGDHNPPAPFMVSSLMSNWELEYKPDTKRTPWFMHAWFEDIHPFVDGNGRVGRLLWWNLSLIKELEPEMILAEDKYDYYKRLDQWRERSTR